MQSSFSTPRDRRDGRERRDFPRIENDRRQGSERRQSVEEVAELDRRRRFRRVGT
jgi:hypothetical protein